MYTLHPSNQLPRTECRPVKRSWSDRIFGGRFFDSHELQRIPFVVQIHNHIYLHPDTVPVVTRFLEKHNMPYTDGERTFEPPKTEANMWRVG